MEKLNWAFETTEKNAAYPYDTMNFHSRISNSLGDGRIFQKISALLFDDELSNKPNFGQIYLAG